METEIMSVEKLQSEINDIKESLHYSTDAAEVKELKEALKELENLLKKSKAELTQEGEPIEEEIQVANELLFASNEFYKYHPEKVLGEIVNETDRNGKSIEVVKGTIEDIKKVNLDYSFTQTEKLGDSIISEAESTKSPEDIDGILKKSESDIAKNVVVKKKKKVETESLPTENMMSFEETYREYNKQISLEELRVYIWHKEQIGQPLNQKWYDLAEITAEYQVTTFGEKSWIDEKVKEGLLFYYDGQLLPAYLYLAENIYEKYSRLIKQEGARVGQDADYIISNYGKDVYDNQVLMLTNAYKKVYEQRLIISEQGSTNALKLVPYSEFCKNFMIKTFINEQPIKLGQTRGGEFIYNEGQRSIPEWKKKEIQLVSLTDGFIIWLSREFQNLVFKKGVSYNDIIDIYINQRNMPSAPKDVDKAAWKAEWERKKERTRIEGERLFNQFLVEQLTLNDKVRIEMEWNMNFNNYVSIDYNKVPIAFAKVKDEVIKPEKRDAVAFLFSQGSGCLAYDVGVGKTIAAIFTIRQYIDSGYCKRPMIVVPNQTYRQWISEIRKFMPDIKVNDLYNLSREYEEELYDENNKVSPVKEGTITMLTYEGFERIGFNEYTENEIFNELYEILNQEDVDKSVQARKKSEKKEASFYQKLQKIIGRGLKNAAINIEDIGTDFICYDEAHAMKKVFTAVKGNINEENPEGRREKTPYKINSGVPSDRGLKGFMISQYILRNNNYRNIMMLTATPFTNSPLEIFSMLSLVAYRELQKTDLNSLSNFFDNYIEMEYRLVVTATLGAAYRQIVTGFRNLPSLQKLIRRFFDFKDATNIAELAAIRPKKWVLPLTNKVVDGNIIKLPPDERIETYIPLTDMQESILKDIVAYAEGEISMKELIESGKFSADDYDGDGDDNELKDNTAENIDDENMTEDEKKGVRIIKSIGFSQNLALSPYLYEYSGLRQPTYQEYVETSPKLHYVMECIKTVKQYHEQRNEEVSGQIIYMNRGIKYFELLKEYLIKVIGYKPHEVGIIHSKMTGRENTKEAVKNLFLGLKYNESIKAFEKLPDEMRMKVLIGSGTIKEGMNLQKKTTVLYNCFLDWNPTDVVQLHGRLHRQGNEFRNVRIVNPLMINSSDIFLFQKLEEKTIRINQIWSTDERSSVLKIEEINPSELKFALIRNPKVIAEYMMLDETNKMEGELATQETLLKKFKNILEWQQLIKYHSDSITNYVKQYRPKKYRDDMTDGEKIALLINLSRTQKDENGLPMEYSYNKKHGNEYSNLSPFSKPSWFDNIVTANRSLAREEKDYFKPRGLDIKQIERFIKEKEFEINDIKKEIELLKSEDNIKKLVKQIEEKKEKEKIIQKQLPEIVTDFEKTNYLLAEKFGVTETKAIEAEEFNCVVLDNQGEIDISEQAIDKLEECLKNQPSTKELYTVNGEYTEERKKFHKKLYEKYQANKLCLKPAVKPIALLTGGSPASGKTTWLRRFAPYLTSDYVYKIDADEIRGQFPENKGWNSALLHEETKDFYKNYLLTEENIGQPCKFDLIFDGTMNSTKNYLPLIGTLRRLGYEIYIVYMNNVSYEVALARSLERFKNGTEHRYVPREVIQDFFTKGKASLNELKSKVDGYVVIDASDNEYNIIESGGKELPSDRDYVKFVDGGKNALEKFKKQKDEIKAQETKEKEVSKMKQIMGDTAKSQQLSEMKNIMKDTEKSKQDLQIKEDMKNKIELSDKEPQISMGEKIRIKIKGFKAALIFAKDAETKKKIQAKLKGAEIALKVLPQEQLCRGGSFAEGGGVYQYQKYVDNIYSQQSEYPAREQLYSFARENEFNIEAVDHALEVYKYDTEENAWGEKYYTKKAIKGMIKMIEDNII